MKYHKHASDSVFWYLNDLGSRVVANTGIPSDRHHLGKLILQSFKDAPDFIMQIDGGTGKSDTFQDALQRSVACANAFRAIGLKPDDVIVLMAPNYNDLAISAYAALYLGIIVAGVDMTVGIKELEDTFTTTSPKVIFCASEKAGDVAEALSNIKLDAKIVTLNTEEKHTGFSEFIAEYGKGLPAEEFKAVDLDPEKSSCWLLATSGTTGAPKYATLTHTNIIMGFPYLWIMSSTFPTPYESALVTSPVQWLSAVFMLVLSPILRFTRIQSSLPSTREHAYFLINKYKPKYGIFSPPMATTLTKPEECDKCDFTCFKALLLGGSAVSQTLFQNMQKIATKAEVYVVYGFSEIGSFAFNFISSAPGSVGRPLGYLHYRLIDPDTQEDILIPNKTGELWVKGPVTFKGYYNNPVATAETFMEDKWIKSGDLFYRDENWNYFFVDRLKMLLKYRNHQISPTEVESVIIKHPGVLDVAVTGIPDEECGDLAVACVVPQTNCTLSAQEIKDLVKESLTDTKQLRGGVIFMKQLPLTSTSKVNRAVLKKIVKDMERE
ncbi:PREDICTED: luciferin 4-monooxygenase-like [Papilio polytes]|uniref:luciferin 4-monooxygenase-like n=1 Tax=Papilio polytes TaxID=76194 RepID=UPI0006769873|nr:PREDICTED: luciferin 4-monooxygenase-like [Papilio polytes]XP_013147249.1 PREDICTED: luciferin 4-monooxygenase-like [Papilio polytes]